MMQATKPTGGAGRAEIPRPRLHVPGADHLVEDGESVSIMVGSWPARLHHWPAGSPAAADAIELPSGARVAVRFR